MSVDVKVLDGRGEGNAGRITKNGQFIVAPIAYSVPITKILDSINVAVNFAKPRVRTRIVVTDIICHANRNVGVNDATFEIYEASAVDSTTIDKSIISLEIPKNENFILTGLNFITSECVFINAKTNDATIFVTIAGYFLENNTEIDLQLAGL